MILFILIVVLTAKGSKPKCSNNLGKPRTTRGHYFIASLNFVPLVVQQQTNCLPWFVSLKTCRVRRPAGCRSSVHCPGAAPTQKVLFVFPGFWINVNWNSYGLTSGMPLQNKRFTNDSRSRSNRSNLWSGQSRIKTNPISWDNDVFYDLVHISKKKTH